VFCKKAVVIQQTAVVGSKKAEAIPHIAGRGYETEGGILPAAVSQIYNAKGNALL